jgi:hypothetical protein
MATYQTMTRDDRKSLQQALTAHLDQARPKSPTPVMESEVL